jgi:glutamate dehydrogenase/leucine dehydrogenase
VVAELRAVAEAAEQRLGPAGLGQITIAGSGEVTTQAREGLVGIGRAVVAMRDRQRAVEAREAAQAQKQEAQQQQRLGIRRGRGMRM